MELGPRTIDSIDRFFFNDTATTEIYTLSLHDALPIWRAISALSGWISLVRSTAVPPVERLARSEEHTSELQSRLHLVCRLLLEKKKAKYRTAAASRGLRAISPLSRLTLQMVADFSPAP